MSSDTTVSFRPEVQADSTGKYYGNAFRFATWGEANQYVQDLAFRWTLVTKTRIVLSDDPVNSAWRDGKRLDLEGRET